MGEQAMSTQATRQARRETGKTRTLTRRQLTRTRDAQRRDADKRFAALLASRPGTGQVQAG